MPSSLVQAERMFVDQFLICTLILGHSSRVDREIREIFQEDENSDSTVAISLISTYAVPEKNHRGNASKTALY